jgi:hypothetical protein
MPLHHFYHLYADGRWRDPVSEHIGALKHHGLFDSLASFSVGIVGERSRRDEAKRFLHGLGVPHVVCTEVDTGWEQETLDQLLMSSRGGAGCYWNPLGL